VLSQSGQRAPTLEADLLTGLATAIIFRQGGNAEAADLTDRCLRLSRSLGEKSTEYADALLLRAELHTGGADMSSAEQDVQQALAIRRGMPVLPLEYGSTVAQLAFMRMLQGRLEESDRLYRENIEFYRERVGENSLLTMLSESYFAYLTMLRGDPATAIRLADDLEHRRQANLPKAVLIHAGCLIVRACSLSRQGHHAEALQTFNEALSLDTHEYGADSAPARLVRSQMQKYK
jgi:tetratricopeptide (TPR) repeat protein